MKRRILCHTAVRDVPLLPLFNHFTALSITPDTKDTIQFLEMEQPAANDEDTSIKEFQKTPPPRLKHWERALPKHFVMASPPSANSLNLKIEIQTTDTAEVKGLIALLDSDATSLFIDNDFAMNEKLTMRSLSHPTPVYNVDGAPNEGGAIWNVVDIIL